MRLPSAGNRITHSLYLHIPFCTHRCAYCDFNTYAGQESSIPAYARALTREIEIVDECAPEGLQIHTVFFGGGTPSLLTPEQFKTILEAISRHFDLSSNAEITIEANPGTVSADSLHRLRQLGINRISFGAQSANGEELRMLERAHNYRDVLEAVSAARKAGFENLNLDLIYGLPEQTLQTWQTTLRRIIDLHPEHVSAYALTLEHGTPFGNWAARGLLPIPDGDAAAEMYEWASEALEGAGYRQYEISNWAREELPESAAAPRIEEELPHFACRHNLQYWRCGPYLGMGAGAHGYAGGYRYSNVLRIKTYIERLGRERDAQNAKETLRMDSAGQRFPLSPATVNQHLQTSADDMSEFMLMGLRLTAEGVSRSGFRERFERELSAVYGDEIKDLVSSGLLEWVKRNTSGAPPGGETSEVLRLTTRGRLLGNQAFLRFV